MPAVPLYPTDFRTTPPRKFKRSNKRLVSMPEHVGPHVRLVFSEMARLGARYDDVEYGAGVKRPAVKAWRRRTCPSLESLESVLGFLGWGFVPVPALEALPADIAGELVTLAKKLERDIPATWAALIDIGVQQRLLQMRSAERLDILAEHDARRANHANDNRKPADNAT